MTDLTDFVNRKCFLHMCKHWKVITNKVGSVIKLSGLECQSSMELGGVNQKRWLVSVRLDTPVGRIATRLETAIDIKRIKL